jgi:glutathione synthase
MKNIALGIVIDPVSTLNPIKDTTIGFMRAASKRGWPIWVMRLNDLFLRDGKVFTRCKPITLHDGDVWFALGPDHVKPISELPCLLMRKDPPFNMPYIYATYLLELAQQEGVVVINDPKSIRDANEKLFASWFPQCCPPTLVTSQSKLIQQFLNEHQTIVLKPLDSMGGEAIFVVHPEDLNKQVIIEMMTEQQTRLVMAQKYLPEIKDGDKRILMIDGEPIPYALARIPAEGSTRGNLVQGARGEGRPLTNRDRWLCSQIGPTLKQKGLRFVGLDVIGDYVTEINVTSPTCAIELEKQFKIDICGQFLDCVENVVSSIH